MRLLYFNVAKEVLIMRCWLLILWKIGQLLFGLLYKGQFIFFETKIWHLACSDHVQILQQWAGPFFSFSQPMNANRIRQARHTHTHRQATPAETMCLIIVFPQNHNILSFLWFLWYICIYWCGKRILVTRDCGYIYCLIGHIKHETKSSQARLTSRQVAWMCLRLPSHLHGVIRTLLASAAHWHIRHIGFRDESVEENGVNS